MCGLHHIEGMFVYVAYFEVFVDWCTVTFVPNMFLICCSIIHFVSGYR